MKTRTPLEEALGTLPLSPGWSSPETFEGIANVLGTSIRLVGFSATASDGRQVTGSAASRARAPVARAYFELLERSAVLDCLLHPRRSYQVLDVGGEAVGSIDHSQLFPESPEPERWQYSRSNGVAAAASFQAACTAARCELVERDRVLRSWQGAIKPLRLRMFRDCLRFLPNTHYSVELYAFPSSDSARNRRDVAGVFAFPRRARVPFVFGTACGANLFYALRRATRECVQRLGFLWGEEIPIEPPDFEPTPLYHQELYLCPSMQPRLRAWLDGRHGTSLAHQADLLQERYVDLTPEHLLSRVHVVKALPAGEQPLTFGSPPPSSRTAPERYDVHPIA